jgi:hypothetical protein
LQLTAFGARDRWYFRAFLYSAPRRQLKRRALGGQARERDHHKRLDWASPLMPHRSALSNTRHLPGVLSRMHRRPVGSDSRPLPGVLRRMLGELRRMPRVSANSSTRPLPGELRRMPGSSACSAARQMPGVLKRMPGELRHMPRRSVGLSTRQMPRRSALGRDRAACPAQHGIAVDRFAREIVRILAVIVARSRQLNAKPLGRYPSNTWPDEHLLKQWYNRS